MKDKDNTLFEKLNAELKPRRQKWIKEFRPTFGPPPPGLPPLREVNHSIPLINPDMWYSSRMPKCSARKLTVISTRAGGSWLMAGMLYRSSPYQRPDQS